MLYIIFHVITVIISLFQFNYSQLFILFCHYLSARLLFLIIDS